MKVFISWSGTTSHRVAKVLRDWLPSVIQNVEPYVSSEDIDKGARWSTDIAGELHASAYGIICLTKDNILAPWINFEAGALGKSIDKSKVSPLLFRVKRSEVEGPILQFQSTIVEKDDVIKLLKSINVACGPEALDTSRLEKTFGVWWPQLEQQLAEIPEETIAPQKGESNVSELNEATSKVLEEILELTRNNHRLLRDPTSILPPDYIQHVMRRPRRDEAGPEVRDFEGRIHLHITDQYGHL
jgi:TIR domain